MSNHSETVATTANAANAAIDIRARKCGEDFLTSSRKVPADLRDCIAGWTGKPWVTAKTMAQADLAVYVMRFLIKARYAWERNPLDRQSMDLWADFGKRVANGLKTSSLDGCAVLCRARADSESAMGKKLPKSGSILGYESWGRANDSTESGTKSRWIEIQINSPKETADITDSIPNVVDDCADPPTDDRSDVNLPVRVGDPRIVGTQVMREPTVNLDAIRREAGVKAAGRSARNHWTSVYRRDVEHDALRARLAELESERDRLVAELDTMKAPKTKSKSIRKPA